MFVEFWYLTCWGILTVTYVSRVFTSRGDTLGKQKVVIISIILWFIETWGRNTNYNTVNRSLCFFWLFMSSKTLIYGFRSKNQTKKVRVPTVSCPNFVSCEGIRNKHWCFIVLTQNLLNPENDFTIFAESMLLLI